MNILCISDTHQKHNRLSLVPCDVLIISGDICSGGDLSEFESFVSWLSSESINFKRAILVAGNHDWCFFRHKQHCVDTLKRELGNKIIYLEDSEVIIDDIKFYGSPWQPEFNKWAFNAPRGERLKQIWSNIPDDVNILITHCPPHGIGDMVGNTHAGCADLTNRLRELPDLFLHVFGHIHNSNGHYTSDAIPGVNFCNAAICTEMYQPENAAHEFVLANLGTHYFMTCVPVYLGIKR
jgi:Icc-related predicted phosphoesterase